MHVLGDTRSKLSSLGKSGLDELVQDGYAEVGPCLISLPNFPFFSVLVEDQTLEIFKVVQGLPWVDEEK